MQTKLENDPRWQRLDRRTWQCPGCGNQHTGLFDLVCDHPASWTGRGVRVPNSELRPESNILSDDYCIIDAEYFFIRCVLQLPVIGQTGRYFSYGVWSTLSRENFVKYAETFNDDAQGAFGPWFGWFSNRLNGYPDTFALKCRVQPRDARMRPTIELEATAHPLALEQREGISFDRILEIYASNGHDIRVALNE
jgi:hypothetical protein